MSRYRDDYPEQALKDLRDAGYLVVAHTGSDYGGAAWGFKNNVEARVITWETEGTCDYCEGTYSQEHDFDSLDEARAFYDSH